MEKIVLILGLLVGNGAFGEGATQFVHNSIDGKKVDGVKIQIDRTYLKALMKNVERTMPFNPFKLRSMILNEGYYFDSPTMSQMTFKQLKKQVGLVEFFVKYNQNMTVYEGGMIYFKALHQLIRVELAGIVKNGTLNVSKVLAYDCGLMTDVVAKEKKTDREVKNFMSLVQVYQIVGQILTAARRKDALENFEKTLAVYGITPPKEELEGYQRDMNFYLAVRSYFQPKEVLSLKTLGADPDRPHYAALECEDIDLQKPNIRKIE
jgi:hypothetical protein